MPGGPVAAWPSPSTWRRMFGPALSRHPAGRRPPRSVVARRAHRPTVRIMTSTTDRSELVSVVDDRLREVAQAGPPVDARRDARRRTRPWLYGPMREYPSRPGKALRPALCLSAGRAFGADATTCSASPWRSSCCTTRSWCTTTSPTAARCGADGRLWPPSHGMAAALNAGDGAGGRRRAGAAPGHPQARPRPRRPGLGRVRHDGAAHARGAGDRGRLAARRCRGPGARGLPEPDHAQDVLVHHDSSAAGRRDRRFARHGRAWVRWCGSGFTSARRSRSATTC